MGKYINDFRAGDVFRLKIKKQIKDTELDTITPINLTGYVFTISFSEDFDSAPKLTKSFTAGQNELDSPADGYIFIEINSEETRLLTPGKYVYDVQMVSSTGDVKTILPPASDYKDKVSVLPDLSPES